MWKGAPAEREFCSMLSGCCSHPEFGLDFTFGRLVDTGLCANLPHSVFAEVVNLFSRTSVWSSCSPKWEAITETTFQFHPDAEHGRSSGDGAGPGGDGAGPGGKKTGASVRAPQGTITDWHNRTLNESRRYRKKPLRFLHVSLGGSSVGIEVQSSAFATYDMAQPLPKPLSRWMRLRQRRTFVLANFVLFHCDLVSARLDMDNLAHMTEASKKQIHERSVSFEIAQFTAHNVHLIHENMEAFLRHVQRVLVQELVLTDFKLQDFKGVGERFLLRAQHQAQEDGEDEEEEEAKVADLVRDVAPLVQQFRVKSRDGHESELEGRLGRQVQNDKGQLVFVSGVSRNHFFWLLTVMEEYKNWCNVDHGVWTDSADLFWDNVRGTKTRDTSGQLPMTFITKDAVSDVTWALDLKPTQQEESDRVSTKSALTSVTKSGLTRPGESTLSGYSARVSRKTEKRLEERPSAYAVIPPVVSRFKRRRSFVFRNKWRYDYTIVGEGTTDEDAFRAPKRYEVEIEALRLEKSNDDEARSLIEKLRQLAARLVEFETRLKNQTALAS